MCYLTVGSGKSCKLLVLGCRRIPECVVVQFNVRNGNGHSVCVCVVLELDSCQVLHNGIPPGFIWMHMSWTTERALLLMYGLPLM